MNPVTQTSRDRLHETLSEDNSNPLRDKYRVKNRYRDTLSEGSSSGAGPLVTSSTEDDFGTGSLRPSYRSRGPRVDTVSDVRSRPPSGSNPKVSQPLVGIQGGTADQVLGLEGQKVPVDKEKWSAISEQLQGAGKLDAFNSLEDKQKAQFQRLAQDSVGEDGKLDPAVAALLEDGKMGVPDAKGNSLAENLLALKNQKFGPGIDGKQVYQEVLDTLRNAEVSDQGKLGTKGTCPVATTQYLSAKNDPAEYVRLMAGLTGSEGKVDMRNGDTLSLHQQLGGWPGRGGPDSRRFSDKVFQDSLMEYASGDSKSWNSAMDAKIVKNPDGISTIGLTGLSQDDSYVAYNAVLPHKVNAYSYEQDSTAARQQAQKDMGEAFQRGVEVPVSMNWAPKGEHARHVVAVEKMDGDYVYIRNPHGALDDGRPQSGPEREVVGEGGRVRMTRDEFFSRLIFYNVPGPVNENGPNPVIQEYGK